LAEICKANISQVISIFIFISFLISRFSRLSETGKKITVIVAKKTSNFSKVIIPLMA